MRAIDSPSPTETLIELSELIRCHFFLAPLLFFILKKIYLNPSVMPLFPMGRDSLVSVLEVIPTAAPQPAGVQIPGPPLAGTATGRQLPVVAGPCDGVQKRCRPHSVRERGLPAR